MGHRAAGSRKKWPWVLGGAVLLIVIIAASGGSDTPAPPAAPAAAGAPPVFTPSYEEESTEATTSRRTVAPEPPDTTSTVSEPGRVTYEVTGSGSASNVTYGGLGGSSQLSEADLPWRKTVDADGSFGSYSLIAQNGGSGDITCKITVGGDVIATQTSSGQYAVVSCAGTTSLFGN